MRGLKVALILIAGLMAPLEAVAQQDALPVQVASVIRMPIFDRVEALGTTVANEQAAITSSVTEKIREILFDDGQLIKKGAVLVRLNSDEERATLQAAEAVFAERKSAFERAQKLGDRQFTAAAIIEERKALMEEAAANVAAARSRLADRTIRAPFDGIIGLRNISVGDLIEPGDEITELTDISVLKLDFTIPAVYLASIRPGLEISGKTAAFGDQAFEGKVASLATTVDPVTRTIVGRAIVPNPDRLLRPGLLMTVSLELNPRNALMIPEEAVIPLGRDAFVFAVEAGEPPVARRTSIVIGRRFNGMVEVLDGLQEGDRVITRGTIQVKDGRPLEIQASAPGSSSPAHQGAEG